LNTSKQRSESELLDLLSSAFEEINKIGATHFTGGPHVSGVDHSFWGTDYVLSELKTNFLRGQKIIHDLNITEKEEMIIQQISISIKNRAESLSATSDGYPIIVTIMAALYLLPIPAAKFLCIPIDENHLELGKNAITLLLTLYLLIPRFKTRRQVSGLKELANHLDQFLKERDQIRRTKPV